MGLGPPWRRGCVRRRRAEALAPRSAAEIAHPVFCFGTSAGRAPAGIPGTAFADVLSSAPLRPGGCGEVPCAGKPLGVGLFGRSPRISGPRLRSPPGRCPRPEGTLRRRRSPGTSLHLFSPSLSFHSLPVLEQLLFKHLGQCFVPVEGMVFLG